jgi:hypothetical protein
LRRDLFGELSAGHADHTDCRGGNRLDLCRVERQREQHRARGGGVARQPLGPGRQSGDRVCDDDQRRPAYGNDLHGRTWTSVPAAFVFQTTDPTTNALTGTANTPADIAQGASQSFVVGFTPSAPFAPADIAFTFGCANASPAASIVGVNTLNLSGSTSPVPDIVALAASQDPGYVDIPGATGTGVFAVATVNLGLTATITASADTGAANLPVNLLLCQTDPVAGSCLAATAATVSTLIAANATPTFGIFIDGSAAVPDLPGVNRVFVRFKDPTGVLRGATSVAVRTQ